MALGFKKIVITFGRYNPPSLGHSLLFNKVISLAGHDDYKIYPTKTTDKLKNPLTFEQKTKWLKKMFPGIAINENSNLTSIFPILKDLVDKNYNHVMLVVGSDRVDEFKKVITPYLNHPDADKKLWLAKFEVVSAGNRDPDADDVTGISASK